MIYKEINFTSKKFEKNSKTYMNIFEELLRIMYNPVRNIILSFRKILSVNIK